MSRSPSRRRPHRESRPPARFVAPGQPRGSRPFRQAEGRSCRAERVRACRRSWRTPRPRRGRARRRGRQRLAVGSRAPAPLRPASAARARRRYAQALRPTPPAVPSLHPRWRRSRRRGPERQPPRGTPPDAPTTSTAPTVEVALGFKRDQSRVWVAACGFARYERGHARSRRCAAPVPRRICRGARATSR